VRTLTERVAADPAAPETWAVERAATAEADPIGPLVAGRHRPEPRWP
jgi:hypothetical protein